MKRRWLLWLLIAVAVWLVIARLANLSKLASTFEGGVWGWVVAAAAFQFVFYVLYACVYQVSFSAALVTTRVRDLVPAVFGSVFANVTLPTGGVSGVALMIGNAVRYGQSAARAAAGILLVLAADFSAFTILLGFGLSYLAVRGELFTYQLVAAGLLLGIIAAISLGLLLGLWRPSVLLYLLHWVQYTANKVGAWFHRPLLPENWAARQAMDFSAASIAIAADPVRLGTALLVALSGQLANLASVYVLFLAFREPAPLGVVVAGYAIGNLFWIVSITPQGIGVVEGAMALAYTSLGVPVAIAAAVVLAYRGLAFWLPFFVGFLLIHRLRLFHEPDTHRPPQDHDHLPPAPT